MNTRNRSQWRRGGIFNLITPSCTVVGSLSIIIHTLYTDSRFSNFEKTLLFFIFRNFLKGEKFLWIRAHSQSDFEKLSKQTIWQTVKTDSYQTISIVNINGDTSIGLRRMDFTTTLWCPKPLAHRLCFYFLIYFFIYLFSWAWL